LLPPVLTCCSGHDVPLAAEILFLKVPEGKLVKNRVHWEVTGQDVAPLVGALGHVAARAG
jgi:hypothetical protein